MPKYVTCEALSDAASRSSIPSALISIDAPILDGIASRFCRALLVRFARQQSIAPVV